MTGLLNPKIVVNRYFFRVGFVVYLGHGVFYLVAVLVFSKNRFLGDDVLSSRIEETSEKKRCISASLVRKKLKCFVYNNISRSAVSETISGSILIFASSLLRTTPRSPVFSKLSRLQPEVSQTDNIFVTYI